MAEVGAFGEDGRVPRLGEMIAAEHGKQGTPVSRDVITNIDVAQSGPKERAV